MPRSMRFVELDAAIATEERSRQLPDPLVSSVMLNEHQRHRDRYAGSVKKRKATVKSDGHVTMPWNRIKDRMKVHLCDSVLKRLEQLKAEECGRAQDGER